MLNRKIIKDIKQLKEDNKSGANEFIEKALQIISSQLDYIEDNNEDISYLIKKLSEQIISSRPSMAPLINTIGFLLNDLKVINKENVQLKIRLLKEKRQEMFSAVANNIEAFLRRIEKIKKIMLISYSSTIVNILRNYSKRDLIIYIIESRPLFEGRHVAEILSKQYETHLIIDAAMGKFIDQIDLILIGVDSILKDGSIINKIGTYPLSVLGKLNDVEVYAVCDSFKYNPLSHYGQKVKIEPKPIREIYDKKIFNEKFNIHNYYFDITPPTYISGVISDLGIFSINEFIDEVKHNLPLDWFREFLNMQGNNL